MEAVHPERNFVVRVGPIGYHHLVLSEQVKQQVYRFDLDSHSAQQHWNSSSVEGRECEIPYVFKREVITLLTTMTQSQMRKGK